MSARDAVTDLRAFRRDPLTLLTERARTHGDLAALRLGPYRALLASHPDHIGEVLVERSREVRKSPVLRAARVVLGDGLLTSEGELHRTQRRLVQPAFGARRLDGYAATMADAAARVGEGWRDGARVDVHAEMLRVTISAAARTLFGSELDGSTEVVETAVDDLLAAYGSPLLPVARVAQWLPLPAFRRLRRGRANLDALVGDVIAAGAEGDHLLGVLVASGMHRRLLRDEVTTLLLAGHETTASMLAWTWWLLSGNSEARAAVEAEADALAEHAGANGEAEADARADRAGAGGEAEARDDRAGGLRRAHLDTLPVTRGALAEALRLYPPSWAMGRQATHDLEVGGTRVRRGTVLIASQWVVHRDPRWWPDPERFDPWRWTDDATSRRPRHAYFPFGAGPRMCVGEQFAWTEGAITLATLARRWRLSRLPGREPVPDPRITLRPRDGVWLRTEAR